jgi:beta-phosphoglucomutase
MPAMDSINARAAIFDLDGTLVDSHDAHFEAWTIVAREIGHALTAEQFRSQFGRTNPPIIRELLEWTGAPPPDDDRIAQLAERKESLFRERIAQSFPVMPGGPALLASLRGAGWRLAVGSSAPPANVAASIEGLDADELFEASITGDDVRHGKPDPEVFLLAASRLGVPCDRCVVFEDAPAGIEAARRAGMACVGLASKGRTREELAAADLVVDALEALSPELIEGLLGSK